MRLYNLALISLLASLGVLTAHARSTPLKVYLECSECYHNEIKEEMTFVQYVRDRAESDVHIKTHSEWLTGGSRRVHLQLLGQGTYAALTDTFTIACESWESATQVHDKIEQHIRAGLVRFMAYSNNLAQIRVEQLAADTAGTPAEPAAVREDPWDHWKVQISAWGYASGESTYDYKNINSSLRAYRVTKANKFTISLNNSYNESLFEYPDGSEFLSLARSNSLAASHVHSIAERVSIGGFAEAMTSTYYSLKEHFFAGPGIEYSFFPYEESSYRHLMLQYRINGHIVNYIEETLYDKTEETVINQSIKLAYLTRKDWGQVEIDLTGGNYLHDMSLATASLYSRVDLNVISGLSLNLSGGITYANDQIYLPKLGATEEETLLRLKQLKTNYTYWSNVGFSFTFGSSDASLVNTRFGS